MQTWQEKENELRKDGFSDESINEYKQKEITQFLEDGFSQKDVDELFGVKNPDFNPVKKMMNDNYEKYIRNADSDVTDFFDFFDRVVMGKSKAIEAVKEGFQESVPVMQYKSVHGQSVLNHEQMPPEYFDTFQRAAKMAGTIAGDLPYMISGAGIGGVVGGAIGAAGGFAAGGPLGAGVGLKYGTIAGAGVGSNALPQALRSYLVNFYEKGEIKSFGDFWERLSASVVDTGKEGLIGGTTEVVGGKVGGEILKKGGGYLMQRTGQAASELATMVGMKSAIEGEIPDAQEFADAAVLVAGLTGSTYAAGKMFRIYEMTGVRPSDVVEMAKKDVALKQQLESVSDEIPDTFKQMVQAPSKDVETVDRIPAPKDDLSVARESLRQNIGAESEQSSFAKELQEAKDLKQGKQVVQKYTKNAAKEVYSRYVRRSYPIKEISEEGFVGYKTFSGHTGVARTMIEDHTFDVNGTKNGEGLSKILNDADDIVGFEDYLVASRVKELRTRDLKQASKVSDEQIDLIIDSGKVKYNDLAKRFYAWNDRVLNYAKESGRLSAEDLSTIKKLNKHYISLKKVVDPDDQAKGSKADPLKKIGSSDLQIKNPLESMIDNTFAMIKISELNRAKLKTIDDGTSLGVFEKVKSPVKKIKVFEDEVIKMMEENGFMTRKSFEKSIKEKLPNVTEKQIEKAWQKEVDAGNTISAEELESFSIFRKDKAHLAADEINVWRDGKQETYQIKDDVLAKAMKSYEENPYLNDWISRAARAVTTTFKLGTTGIPDFIAQNVIVDYTTSILKSTDIKSLKENINPKMISDAFKNNLAAFNSLVKKDAGFYEYMKSGAFGSGWADAETALLKITEGKYQTPEFNEIHSKSRNVIQSAKQFYETAQLLSEHFVRIKTFQDNIKAGKELRKSGIAAKEITLDFSEKGYDRALANYSAITAFQNVAIQGTDNFVRTIKENPKSVVNALAFYTTSAVALWLVNKDDERYDNTPEWEKLTYFHIFTDDWVNVTDDYMMSEADAMMSLEKHDNLVRALEDGTIQINKGIPLKIRKVPVFGELFATLPTILLDKFFKERPTELKEFTKSFFQNALPSMIPNVVVPVAEQWANKSFFTGNNIVPYSMKEGSPSLQYTEYTNESARALGRLIEAVPVVGSAAESMGISSPVVLENYVRQWTGGGGMYLLNLASSVTPQSAYQKYDIKEEIVKPAWQVGDIPFVKRFVARFPSAGAQPLRNFGDYYEKYKQLETDSNIERSRWNYEGFTYLKQQQMDEFAPIKGINEAIKNQSALIHIINKRDDLNATEKRQLIDATYFQMIGLAQKGLEMIRQFEEDQKQFKEMGYE